MDSNPMMILRISLSSEEAEIIGTTKNKSKIRSFNLQSAERSGCWKLRELLTS
jgi:hypothetical protein